MSAKKYLKTVPPQPPAQPAAKTEKEEQLWNALKRHIMRERERKKQELEAEVEEERQRKEREAREKQDVMTLGETKEQISMMEKTLQELRNEKQQLFLQLKKVLNEDDNIRKRQMKEAAEMFPVHNIQQQQQQQQQQQPPPPQQQQQQIFLPAGRPTNPLPPHQQHLIHKVPTQVNPPVVANVGKRTHSPSPQNYYPKPNTSQSYALPPQAQKIEEGRRGPGEVARAVLWNKSQYCPPGTLFYPTAAPPPQGPPTGPPQDNRQPQPQQIIYPPYPQANIAMPIRQSYHVELPPQGGSQKAPELIKTGPGGPPPSNVYHITLDQQGIPQQAPQNPGPPPQLKAITIEKIPDQYVRQSQPPQQPPPPTSHLPEGIVYTSALRPGAIPMHAIAANQQMSKGGGGSITQGYPPARPPQIVAQPQPPPGQMHYPRHRY